MLLYLSVCGQYSRSPVSPPHVAPPAPPSYLPTAPPPYLPTAPPPYLPTAPPHYPPTAHPPMTGHITTTVGYPPVYQRYIDNQHAQGCMIDPNFMIPENGTLQAFAAYLDFNRSRDGKVSFMVVRPMKNSWTHIRNNYITGSSIDAQIVLKTGWKDRYNYDGKVSHINLTSSEKVAVTEGDILGLCYKSSANPVPYATTYRTNLCHYRMYMTFTNSSRTLYNQNGIYNLTVTNDTLYNCRKYAFQAIITKPATANNTRNYIYVLFPKLTMYKHYIYFNIYLFIIHI